MLLRKKFRRYLGFGEAIGYVTWLHRQAESISAASGEIPRYAADPDDDYLAALALASEADFLVSGDRHLLDLGEIKDGEGRTLVYVRTPREFLEELRRGE